MANVPWTRTLLKGNIWLRTVPGGAFMPNADAIAASMADLPVVGAAQFLEINQTRETNNARREFNPQLQGQPAETYPGIPHYSVTLHRTNLYDYNLQEAFGFTGVNIVDQYIPIVLVGTQVVPVDASGNPLTVAGRPMQARTYIIQGCWFDNIPLEFDIEADDQKMVQEIDMICMAPMVF